MHAGKTKTCMADADILSVGR